MFRLQGYGIAKLWLSAVLLILLSSPVQATSPSYQISTVGAVPGTQDLENLVVRHTGEILVTSTHSGSLHQLDPKTNTSTEIVKIANASSTLGIAELERDIFYVFASNYADGTAPYTNTVWKINMTCHPATATLIANVSSAQLLNGMTALSPTKILGADSSAGNVVLINTLTGHSSIAINDTTMHPLPTGLGIGVNGIKIFDRKLYYTSLDQHIFARIPISLETGFATGPAEILANITGSTDDFILSADGKKAWIAINGVQDGGHVLQEVDIEARSVITVSNSTLLQATSAVAHIPGSNGALYITGAANVGNGTIGAVLRADPL